MTATSCKVEVFDKEDLSDLKDFDCAMDGEKLVRCAVGKSIVWVHQTLDGVRSILPGHLKELRRSPVESKRSVSFEAGA